MFTARKAWLWLFFLPWQSGIGLQSNSTQWESNFYTHLEAGHLMDNLKESFSGTKNLEIRNSRPEKKKIKLIFFYYKNKIKQFELTKL